jgi:hypothetical protein
MAVARKTRSHEIAELVGMISAYASQRREQLDHYMGRTASSNRACTRGEIFVVGWRIGRLFVGWLYWALHCVAVGLPQRRPDRCIEVIRLSPEP